MNALVELIKRIGIFMIAAQAVIHFAPDRKYAKYMKLIAGVMILLQFLSPIYEIVCGATMDWSEQMSNMEQELKADVFLETFAASDSALETVTNSIEREIKSKLNNGLNDEFSGGDLGYSYTVTSVRVSLVKSDAKDENDVEYKLDKIDVAVWRHTEDRSNIDIIEKVQIDKISITKDGTEGKESVAAVGDEQEVGDSLRRRFCSILGVDEKYMEVRVYGAY